MNLIIKLVVFSIMINFASGIVITAIPALAADPTTTPGIFYDDNYTKEIVEGADEAVITPDATVTDTLSANLRLLDFGGIGFISSLKNFIITYLYGFPALLNNTIGVHLDSNIRAIFFGTFGLFPVIITFGNFLLILYLWTGRKVVD